MKRKVLGLFLIVVLSVSFAACGSEKEASDSSGNFDSFMEVQKNMSDVKDMEFKMNMDAVVSGQDPVNMSMSGTGKEIVQSKDDIQLEMKYKMNIPDFGSDMEGTMYMKDQAVYMDLMGQKLKVDASNEMSSMMNVDTSQLLAITEEMISALKVERDGSDTVYTFQLDADKAMDYFENNVSGAQQLTTTDDMSFDKMDVTVVAGEDKMVKSIDMDCSITTQTEDDPVKMDYKISMDYISINTDLKIDFPDFSQYQELTV